ACKCCGCKATGTVGATERRWVRDCLAGDDCETVCEACADSKDKCKCDGECKCCDCQTVAKEGTTPDCTCGECACCGCKAKKDTECSACGGEDCCCKDGKCACGKEGKCGKNNGCCWFTISCPLCPLAEQPCEVGWLVITEVCPAARLYTMCP